MTFACIVAGALFFNSHNSVAQATFDAQRIVERFVAVHPSEDGTQLTEVMQGGVFSNKFDANRYFAVLDKLHPESGYVLDWVYWKRGIGALPVLYMRKTDVKPYASYELYATEVTNTPHEADLSAAETRERLQYGYIRKLQVEDSPEGYFQLVVMRLLGDRFHFFWHEFYNEIYLVCSKPAWEALLLQEKSRGAPYEPPSSKFIAAAKKHDFTPKIKMVRNRQVEVSVTTYSPFGGLSVYSFIIGREYPHQVLQHSQTNILRHAQKFVF